MSCCKDRLAGSGQMTFSCLGYHILHQPQVSQEPQGDVPCPVEDMFLSAGNDR